LTVAVQAFSAMKHQKKLSFHWSWRKPNIIFDLEVTL